MISVSGNIWVSEHITERIPIYRFYSFTENPIIGKDDNISVTIMKTNSGFIVYLGCTFLCKYRQYNNNNFITKLEVK